MKLILLIIIFSSSVFAGPSRTSCAFYQELESEFPCGRNGYVRKFGKPLCEKYLKAEPYQTEGLAHWFQEVRFCLQDELDKNLHESVSCHEIRNLALSSHVGCYQATGFCELSVKEKLTVVRLTSGKIFTREALGLALKLPGICP
ncbi:MAG: hypothetical protein V4598_02100 [Bdellovibrionota bacterium]